MSRACDGIEPLISLEVQVQREAREIRDHLRDLLAALVEEVGEPCFAPKSAEGPVANLAEGDEPICGRPARWGILTAWTCSKHRRERDKKPIGGPALQAAIAAL